MVGPFEYVFPNLAKHFVILYFLWNVKTKWVAKGSGHFTWLNHFKPASSPHCQVRSFVDSQMPTNVCKFNLAPEAAPNLCMTLSALSMLSKLPSRKRRVSSANIWFVMLELSGNLNPRTS